MQVLPYRLGLFRAKLLVQIFPETDQDFFTFHPLNPHKTRQHPVGRCLQNRGVAHSVPDESLPETS